jgi:hypothetical protein
MHQYPIVSLHPLVKTNFVPIADNHCMVDQPFVAVGWKADPVTQISDSLSFT